MPITAIQPSFAAGELSPALYSRVDLAQYAIGARTMRNMLVHPHGGASNRPGTEFIAAAKAEDQPVRLIPFEYSTEQAYVLEFGHLYMRVYANGGQVVDGGVPVEIATPYLGSELAQLQVTQSADTLFMTHPNHAPYTLSRLSATSWQLIPCSFAGGPLLPMNATDYALKVEATRLLWHPTEDLLTTGWTATPAGACYAAIDESIDAANDTDFVSCTTTSTLRVLLNAGTSPMVLDGYVLRVRLSCTAASDVEVVFGQRGYPEPGMLKRIRSWKVRASTAATTYTFFLPKEDCWYLGTGREPYVEVTMPAGKVYCIELETPSFGGSLETAAWADAYLPKGGRAVLRYCHPDDPQVLVDQGIFEAGYVGGVFGIQYTTKPSAHTVLSPARYAWESSAFRVAGDWTVTLDCVTNRAEAALYLERSQDDGENWVRVHTWPATSSTAQMVLSGNEQEPCWFRFTRPQDPTSGDEVKFTLEVQGSLRWAFFQVYSVAADGVTANVTLLSAFDQPFGRFTSWAEGAWSDYRGWPACICFHPEDRLCFANTKTQPQTVWMSRTGSYLDFGTSLPTQDDDAITATILSRKVNAIRALVPLGELIALTSGAEFVIGTGGNGPVTPSSISAKAQGYRGAAAVYPEIVGNDVLFVQAMGSALRNLTASNEAQGFTGDDISVLSQHLLEGYTVADMAYQQVPWSVLWMVRSDGVLLGLTYMKEHQVFAWHHHDTAGAFESICTIPGSGEDEVWFVVRRTVGGVTRRYIERMARRRSDDLLEAHFLDCGLDYSGDPATTLSGLDHLEGCTVTALSDGKVVTGLVVAGGQITLPAPVARVHVGLPYTSDLETLGVEYQAGGGTAQGKKKQIKSVVLRLERSKGGSAGMTAANLKPFGYPAAASYPYTGDVAVSLSSTYDTAGRALIRQSEPLPLTVLAVIPEVEHGG